MNDPNGYPARLKASQAKHKAVAWSKFNQAAAQGSPVGLRVLMADGKWLVPEGQRPKLAPPPQERDPRVDRMIHPENGLMG